MRGIYIHKINFRILASDPIDELNAVKDLIIDELNDTQETEEIQGTQETEETEETQGTQGTQETEETQGTEETQEIQEGGTERS